MDRPAHKNSAIRLKKIGFIIVLLAFAIIANAQQFNFHYLDDGPKTACYSIIQDKKGFIWMSTEDGVCKYDGNSYKWFNKDESGKAISSSFNLVEDSQGCILFNTLDGSLFYIKDDSIHLASCSKKLVEILVHGRSQILSMYVDKNHILWIGSGKGLFKTTKANDYSDITNVQRPLNSDSCRYGAVSVDDIKLIPSLYKSIVKKRGLDQVFHAFIYRDNKTTSAQYELAPNYPLASYFTAVPLSNGISLCDIRNNLFVFYPDGETITKILNSDVLYMYRDNTKGLWISMLDSGLAYYANGSPEGNPICSLKGCSVTHVIQDIEGGIWVTTLNKGVFHADSKYILNYDNIDGLNDNIRSIHALNDKILVNDSRNFISIIEGEYISRKAVPHTIFIQIIPDFCTWGNKIYIATAAGILETDTSLSKKWSNVLIKGKADLSLVYNFSFSRDKVIYCSTTSSIISIVSDTQEMIDSIHSRGQNIFATREGEVFLGCIDGLYKVKDHKSLYLGKQDKFLGNGVNYINEDISGVLWIGTSDNGIGLYKDGKILSTISIANGLASNKINYILFDSNDNAWVATDKGLSKIYLSQNYRVENFDSHNGLISDNINKLTLSGHQLWLATKLGLYKVDIDHFGLNKVSPPVYISALYVNDSISYGKSDFSHNLNNFRFHMVGLTFKDNKSRFSYRLIGIDTVWRAISSPDVQFNNLTPGKYKFEAKAINADGISSLQPVVFSFVIESPFWLRWWFILIEVLLGGLLVYLFIRFRLKGIEKREAEKTRINKMLAEYQMTALSAQMNPHFVFNAINSIQDYILGNNSQQAYDYLTKFAQLVRMVLENAKEKTVTLEKDMELLKMYVELEQLRFANKFDVLINIDHNVDLYNIQLPSMIIQPYVENAIWHGLMPLGGLRKGLLKIDLRMKSKELVIVVEDNGIGREASKKIRKSTEHKSVGMEITKNRLEVLNNLLGSNNSEIKMKDLYNDKMQPVGTHIEIRITINND